VQYLFMLFDPAGFDLFFLVSTLISLSLFPFALTRRAAPEVPAMAGLDLRRVYEISPLGIIGCFAVGVGNGAFWGLGPLFAQGIGLPVAGISIFMSAVIVGGMLMQVPLGRLSDRLDRRKLIITACLANTLLGIAISAFGARSELLL